MLKKMFQLTFVKKPEAFLLGFVGKDLPGHSLWRLPGSALSLLCQPPSPGRPQGSRQAPWEAQEAGRPARVCPLPFPAPGRMSARRALPGPDQKINKYICIRTISLDTSVYQCMRFLSLLRFHSLHLFLHEILLIKLIN